MRNKKRIQLLVISLITLLFVSCKSDDDSIPKVYFRAVVNGETLSFQDPEIIIKTINGSPYTQEVTGTIVSNKIASKVLKITFIGTFIEDKSPISYGVNAGLYYENDYKDSWACFSWANYPKLQELTVTRISDNKAWGYSCDFDAKGNLGTVSVTNIEFSAIPIHKYDFIKGTGPVE